MRPGLRQFVRLSLAGLLAMSPLAAQLPSRPIIREKPQKEPKTQVLETPPEPPAVAVADAARLIFRLAPASSERLMSQQVRSGLRALLRDLGRARVVHLRAFVSGSGDPRRVQDVVSEEFTGRRLPLPSLSVIQCGPLAAPLAQVSIEAVAEEREPRNPHGLAFIAGQTAAPGEEVLDVAPVVRQSLEKIRSAAASLGVEPADVLQVTCYCSSLQDGEETRKAMAAAFPSASRNHLQSRRDYTPSRATCEAVARLRRTPADAVRFWSPGPTGAPAPVSQAILVRGGRLAFSGTQIAFGHGEPDIRLAFERLSRSLDENGISMPRVVFSRYYTLSDAIAGRIRSVASGFFDRSRPPASTLAEFESLPSLDASLAVEVVAAVP